MKRVAYAVAIGLFALTGCSKAADKAAGPTTTSVAPKVGVPVKVGVWTAQVYAVADPLVPTNPIVKPKDGFRYVTVDLALTNNSGASKAYSSLLNLKLKDSDNKAWSIAITGETLPAAPDGNFGVGETKRGTVAFEVPTTSKGLVLAVDEGDLVNSKNVSIPLS